MKKITYMLLLSALFITNQIFAQENNISENGNIGIGTGSTAPTARLQVVGTTRIDSTLTVNDSVVMTSSARVGEDLKVEGNLYIPNIPALQNLTNELLLIKDLNGLTQAISAQSMAGKIYSLSCELVGVNPIWNNGPNKLYTECSGVRVGIGTSNPEFTFDCRGDAKTSGNLWANQSLSIGTNAGTFSKVNILNTNRPAVIYASTVGNTQQYQRLMRFEYNNPDTKIMEVFNTSTNHLAFELRADGQMDLHNGVANIFHFGTNGMFSVSNNTQKTFVVEASGLTRARKIKVDADVWADYVFEPTYKLMPLSEVESFVKKHKHLPSIPSEKVMKAEGIDLAEMNVKMMEKIEELTLYLIQQNKELESLKAELETLKHQKP